MIKIINPKKYRVPLNGFPLLHRNLTWYATDDDRVLGVVILDLVDYDFSWVVLTENEQGRGYTAVNLDHSLPTQQMAIGRLHTAMFIEAGRVDG